MINTVDFKQGKIILIDQTKLPAKFKLVKIKTWQSCIWAIKEMIVRGAPAIGVTGALGVILAAYQIKNKNTVKFLTNLKKISAKIAEARPTAVNLRWGVERMLQLALASSSLDRQDMITILEKEGTDIVAEDIAVNKALGEHGLKFFKKSKKYNVLTHCNAGALATVNWGTALGVIRSAHAAGKIKMVYADETRPRLQGGKLTAWELAQDNIPVTVLTDNMAGYMMKQGKIDLVVVGADRIARNGDTCNKIGTYGVAVLAKAHGIPFYIAAPFSTIDKKIKDGTKIPIEERSPQEVTHVGKQRILAANINIINPAFDVTPAKLITGIITEKGIFTPAKLAKALK
jgi:methylthioribose-1-phosphate isomerase